MKAIEILNQLKDTLGIELSEENVQMATMKLENGTSISSVEFVSGSEVFIEGDDGSKISLPIGEYSLEDSRILVVSEEGLIAEIKDAAQEAPAEEAEAEVEAAQEEAPESKIKSKTESTQVVYATKEEVSEVKLMIEELKSILEKKELSKEPTEEVEDIKEVELSGEIVEPIAHNPEAVNVAQNIEPQINDTHVDRIRNMIYNNK
jgi:hypothetical protein|tara:strand:+ start:2224 stop:2838 length:615 start_codon:yes stop_codon:yes gene_type:complete